MPGPHALPGQLRLPGQDHAPPGGQPDPGNGPAAPDQIGQDDPKLAYATLYHAAQRGRVRWTLASGPGRCRNSAAGPPTSWPRPSTATITGMTRNGPYHFDGSSTRCTAAGRRTMKYLRARRGQAPITQRHPRSDRRASLPAEYGFRQSQWGLPVAGAGDAVWVFSVGFPVCRLTSYLDAATRQVARPKAAIATASSAPAQAPWKTGSRPPGW